LRVVQRRTDAELIIVPQDDGEPIVVIAPDADLGQVRRLARLLLPDRQRQELDRQLDGRRGTLALLAAAGLTVAGLLGPLSGIAALGGLLRTGGRRTA
jgi:hypothetical protein